MASHDLLDSAARGDFLVCRSAVLLLRARRKAAVAPELETDPESSPATLRRAAVQLAERLVRPSSIPMARYGVDDELVELRRSNHRETSATDHRSGPPVAQSIRLGRMG